MLKEQLTEITRLSAEIIYQDNHPFILWNTPAMRTLLRALNPAFAAKIPGPKTFSTTLL